jgi:membrane fusion protein, multidrug efflux system
MMPTDSSGPGNRPPVPESDKGGTHVGEPATRPAMAPVPAKVTEPKWQKWASPLAVVLLAAAVVFTITRNWNGWEGNRIEQVTDDAYVWGDITPLSTKVDGIVQDVKVSDFQTVHKGDILVELENKDFLAQVSQANAAVVAAKAAIDENRRQRELQDSVISKALTGVDQAKDQIAAAQDAIEAARADVVRAEKERRRQEALFQTQSTTRQTLEQAVDAAQSYGAQLASREAALAQAKALLASSELGVEAEKLNKVVLESQEAQLIADLHAKEDALTVANIDLGYTTIAAPADGAVGERQVRQGQFVSPGTEVIPFVDRVKWVQANYRETQLTHVRVGDPAEIRIDEYPGQVFHGKVIEISPASGSQFALLPPDNATGNFTKVVQRIPVKISLDDPAIATGLTPGLSVVATVRTSH